MKICGIYKITSPSGKIYIGQSGDVHKRWGDHKREMKYDYKKSKLKSSFKKYDFDNHKFEIIHECGQEQLNELEKYYVDLFQTFNSEFGLNLRDGGGSKGKNSEETKALISIAKKNPSPETRHKMSESAKISSIGRKWTEEQKAKFLESRKGFKHSNETKKRMGDIQRNKKRRPMSEETKRKIGAANKGKRYMGRKHSEESKKKMSESAMGKNTWSKGRKMSEEQKNSLIKSLTGKKQSAEHIEKNRLAHIGLKWTLEHRNKMVGRKHSELTKKKISDSLKLIRKKNVASI